MVSILSEKRRFENGERVLAMCSPTYKRRKVYAVRDFPSGCGPNGIRMDGQKNEVEGGGGKVNGPAKDLLPGEERGYVLLDAEGKGSLEKMVESERADKLIFDVVESKIVEDGVRETPKLVIDHQSNDVLNDIIIEDPVSSQDLLKKPLGNKVVSPISLKDTLLSLKEACNDIQSEHVVEGTSLRHYPIPPSLVWKERRYPPRRKVSASRDFPLGCGCDVERLNEANPCKEIVRLDHIEGDLGANGSCRSEMKGVGSGDIADEVVGQSTSNKEACAEVSLRFSHKSSEIKRQEEVYEPTVGVQRDRFLEKEECTHEDDKGIECSEGMESKDLIVYVKDKFKKKPFGVFSNCNEPQEKGVVGVRDEENVALVQGFIATRKCKQRMTRSSSSAANAKKSKRMKSDQARQNNTDNSGKGSKMIVPRLKDTETKEVSAVMSEEDSSEDDERAQDFRFLPRRPTNVTLSSLDVSSSNETGARNKVRGILKLFQAVVRKFLQEETKNKDETKSKHQENSSKRIDLRASKLLKDHGKCINTGKNGILGPIPGVEVGDFFHYRIELSMIGLHRLPQGGIDYLKQGDMIIATSIVASGGYANDVDSSDVLIYTGQGGNASGDKQAEDQKLERGNLALKNSIDVKNAVRVIRGFKESKSSETADSRPKLIATYTYDGLYTVEKYWQDHGPHGKLVYKFQLRRLPGQPELAWKEVKKSKKHKVREGRCVDDISGGKEIFPICAINTIDNEKPPESTYITRMSYPDWCQPIPPTGCDCKNGCLDSEHCACAVKNGGEIPYNHNGAIVEVKPLVYECGPSCKCPPTCLNRVSQCGIRFPLEIFKTESRGWGVRSLSSIPSGSFICEYLGELLDEKEAEQRLGNDEYLFDIGRNFNDSTLMDGLSTLLPDMAPSYDDVVENIGFTIDALKYGNIGRFFNHSCSPNLYAQNVLFDHADKRIPHVMLFASENIPPLQELTYHYNYTIDQVFDSDGNIKKKNCYCGSSECTGRMY